MIGRIKLSGAMICMCIGILILTAGYAVLREREGDAPGDGGGLAENQGMDQDSERIAVLYADIYERVAENSDLGSAELIEQIVEELGGHGVTAIDGDNQTNMVNAGKAEAFVRRQASGESGNLTVIRVLYPDGFAKYDMRTENRKVFVERAYYEYREGAMEHRSSDQYEAGSWKYTEEGYVMFEGELVSEEQYALTMSAMPEYTAMRVKPLSEACRKLNRQYIRPIGYGRNNLFLTDWTEADFGQIDFQDLFDICYPLVYGKQNPYADRGIGTGEIAHVPGEEFERAIQTYFQIDRKELQKKSIYFSGDNSYGFRTREMGELEFPEIPYPEVVSYEKDGDGLLRIMVNAVYPERHSSKIFTHEVTVRILPEGGFRYVSNHVVSSEKDAAGSWHRDRKSDAGTQEESSLWAIPQAERCLLAEKEKKELQTLALEAGEQVKEVYRDVEIMEGPSYGSNIKEFTAAQRKETVRLLGKAGFTSVTKDCNMENPQNLEAFYDAYRGKKDALATVVQVNQDGLLGVITFVYRNGNLQTYYIGIRWREGGEPVIRDTSVSDVSEIKLTEKGYFIYAYKVIVAHAALRQYWRITPLSDCYRELAAVYIDGLSYVNYNLLVRNWDAGNVKDILTAGLFEDLYRMDTGEPFRAEQGRIPAEVFERILTTYLPVTTEQLREAYAYEEQSGSYLYERISLKAHPPFGEVVGYAENGDGTLTLIVDGVWPDYNSDCAFTNQIVVMPFADGSFRYLSNTIWQKELEIPRGIVTAEK